MTRYRDPIRGRGTNAAPKNRFEAARFEPDTETGFTDDETPDPRSQFIADATKSALSKNQSPDVGFDVGLNPYRGCEHGCIYCYARPTHEYLGYSAGLDFETRILVKHELPQLLRAALSAKSWEPQTIGISGVTDAYQPIERKLEITRRSLAVLAEFRNPCAIITKSRLVVRDTDLLQELAKHEAVSVTISLTTLKPELARKMEPRAAQPRARLWTIAQLARAGVPVGVNLAPIVPGLTEHEIPALVAAAADAGAKWAGWQLVRLPYAVKDLFAEWLAAHYPDRREKVLHRIADVRDGKLNASDFAVRHRGTGLWSEQIAELVALARRRSGIPGSGPSLSAAAFRRPGAAQLRLF